MVFIYDCVCSHLKGEVILEFRVHLNFLTQRTRVLILHAFVYLNIFIYLFIFKKQLHSLFSFIKRNDDGNTFIE